MSLRNRRILLVLLLVFVPAAYYATSAFQEAARERRERQALLEQAAQALAEEGMDPGDGRLMARLLELGPQDLEARILCGRLELKRGRPERAVDHLRVVVAQNGDLESLRLAAEAWVQQAERAGGDPGIRRSLLVEGLAFAERAANSGGQSADWFLAWQAATRLGEAEAEVRARASLESVDASSLQARTVAMLHAMAQPDAVPPAIDAVTRLVEEWGRAPLELRLLECALRLSANDLESALRIADAALSEAPSRFEARNLAATARHSAWLQSEPGPERDRHAQLRNAQIDWLDANAEPWDPRRPTWLAWRQQR